MSPNNFDRFLLLLSRARCLLRMLDLVQVAELLMIWRCCCSRASKLNGSSVPECLASAEVPRTLAPRSRLGCGLWINITDRLSLPESQCQFFDQLTRDGAGAFSQGVDSRDISRDHLPPPHPFPLITKRIYPDKRENGHNLFLGF